MKKIIVLLVICFLIISCKTKSLTVEKSSDFEKILISKQFDSLLELFKKNESDFQKIKFSFKNNLNLTSVRELDSNGVRIPFHYKYYVDGILKEELFLEGGEINSNSETDLMNESEHTVDSQTENIRVDVHVGQKKEVEKESLKKAKKVEVKGFQFGFYLWLLLLILAVLVLRWLSKKFKIFDGIKTILKIGAGRK